MGNLTSIGTSDLSNIIHIVINNSMHQSVGIQPTVGFKINLSEIASNCGYKVSTVITNYKEFDSFFKNIRNINGPIFVEIRVSNKTNYTTELPRPKDKPVDSKEKIMKYI